MTLPILVAVLITAAMIGVGGATTQIGRWYKQELRKPSWNPPDWLFGPAWSVILACAGGAGALAWIHARNGTERLLILGAFAVNIVLHTLWSPLFFNLRRPDWALMEVPFLWLSILAVIIVVTPISLLAGFLLAPYLLWVAFAAFLNFTIVRLNPPFGRS